MRGLNPFVEGQRSIESCKKSTRIISREQFEKLPKAMISTTKACNGGMQKVTRIH